MKAFSKKTWLVLLVVVIAVTATVVYAQTDRESKISQSLIDVKNNLPLVNNKPSPSPFPFQEITIPYLQNREYTSQLGELEEHSQASTYTRYLTSYDSDGLRVNGMLFVPKGDAPEGGFPAVVFIHGYIPPSVYSTQQNYTNYANYLANQGIVVFKIDLRGHGESDGEASGAYYSGDYVIDTLNAHSALQNADFVNPEQVGLWGHSMAGNVVFRAATANPEVKKTVIWAGAVFSYEDWQEYGLNDNSYRPPATQSERRRRRQELFDTHGEFDATSWFWQQVPATNYLDDLNSEIQLHHATNDSVVNVNYSRDLAKTLDEANIPNQLFEYSSGGHNIEGGFFNQAMSRSGEFLKDYSAD